MKAIRTHKIAATLIRVDPVVLDETSTTRRIFLGELALDAGGKWNVRGTFVVERRSKTGWQQIDGSTLGKLKAGELAKLELRSEQVKNLVAGLHVLNEAAELEGVALRSTELIVSKKEEVVRVVKHEHKAVIDQIIAENHGPDFWDALTHLQPDIAAQLADAEIQRKRKSSLREFQDGLQAGVWNEPDWERFFIANQWIFGYGLRYQFLNLLQNQAYYGGATYARKGGQKGEFLMATQAEQRFTVLVEIKRPDSMIFDANSSNRAYRSGVPGFSTEFANAISQLQVNTRTWETEGSRREGDREALSRAGVHTISPRAILIFGHTHELATVDKRNAFGLFRSNLRSPDILTFDELLERARFIVDEADQKSPTV